MSYFIELGFLGLFLSAFAAATILPLSSELVLSALLLAEFDPILLLIVATLGNVLGSVVNYLIGAYGGDYLRTRFLKMDDHKFARIQQRYQKWGSWSLLFAWVPIIGDPLTLVAGTLRVNFLWFLLLVTLGKGGRYAVIVFGFTL